jgi:DNA polymerase-3 subunit delta
MLRMPPFKAREFLGGFSDRHMQQAFRLFAQTDGRLKGGSATAPARILDALGLELCRLAERPQSKAMSQRAGLPPRGAATKPVQPAQPIRSVRPTGR